MSSLTRKADLLERKSAELEKELAERDKKIADLEHRLAGRKKDSTNSSKPPSSDGPPAGKRVYPQRKKSGRKPGGQKGHPRKHRLALQILPVVARRMTALMVVLIDSTTPNRTGWSQ